MRPVLNCLPFIYVTAWHGVNYVDLFGVDCMLFCTESTFCITDIITGSIKERRKVKVIPGVKKGQDKKQVGHSSHILSIALSSDGQFLVCLLALKWCKIQTLTLLRTGKTTLKIYSNYELFTRTLVKEK